jgi:hypothetical protein
LQLAAAVAASTSMCKVLRHHAIITAALAATSINNIGLKYHARGFLCIIAATNCGTKDVRIRADLWSDCLQDKPADDGQAKDAAPKSLDPMAQPPHGTEVGTAASRACPASRGLQADHLCVVTPAAHVMARLADRGMAVWLQHSHC